eukprot:tig00020603_g11764.t1
MASAEGEEQNETNFVSYQREGVLGCPHYQRAAALVAPCCSKVFACHWCHDEAEVDHALERKDVKEVVCMRCHTRQPVGRACSSPACKGAPFASYFCERCLIYESNPERPIYHCEDCAICRVGKGLGTDYFHCEKCAACISVDHKEHRCVEGNTKNNCPICFEFMFTSRNAVVIAKCGHAMHEACFKQYTRSSMYTCPVCFKSLGDMEVYFTDLDRRLENEAQNPAHEQMRTRVTCNDCERRSLTRYHAHFHKCGHCRSYNTTVIEHVRVSNEEGGGGGGGPGAGLAPAEGPLAWLRGAVARAAKRLESPHVQALAMAGLIVVAYVAALRHRDALAGFGRG